MSFFYVIFEFIVKEIVDEIKKCKVMIVLRMEGNILGVDVVKVIVEILEIRKEF